MAPWAITTGRRSTVYKTVPGSAGASAETVVEVTVPVASFRAENPERHVADALTLMDSPTDPRVTVAKSDALREL